MECLNLYVEHPSIGYGWRLVIVAKRTRKKARLIDFGTAAAFTVDADMLRGALPVDVPPKRLAKALRRNASAFGRNTKALRDVARSLAEG